MKKIVILFLTLFSLLPAMVAQTAEQPIGDGSAGNPYRIATLNNLYWITQRYKQLE